MAGTDGNCRTPRTDAGVRKEREEHVARWLGEGGGESWSPREGTAEPPQGQAAATASGCEDKDRRGLLCCSSRSHQASLVGGC